MKKRFVLLAAAAFLGLSGCQNSGKQADDTAKEVVQSSEKEEKQEEEQKKEQKEKQPQEYKVDISDRLSDFQFAINEKVWNIPSKMEEWYSDGWVYGKEKEKEELDIESYLEGETLTRENISLTVDLVNLESEKKPLKDCYVGGVSLQSKKKGTIIQLPGKLILGRATLNEVLKQYGTPTDEYEEKNNIYLTYEFGIYKEAELVFDIKNEILHSVSMKNYREPEQEQEDISSEEPEAVSAYEAPQEFSDNPADYIALYDNQFYRIPAPVSQFTANGWRIEEDGSDTYVKPGRHGYVTLEKDGQTLYAVVKNYAEQTVEVSHSFVTNLSGDFDVIKVPIALAKDITLGMSEENLKIQLDGISYENSEEESGTSYYIYSDETKKNFIHIFVDKDLKLVREIEISNSPETLSGTENDGQQESPDSSVLIDENKLSDEQE